MKQLVLEVTEVAIYDLLIFPKQVIVIAQGLVQSTGWTEPTLVLSKEIPEDGIYKFNFIAKPPTESANEVLTPIIAHYIFDTEPINFKGVQVRSATNSIIKSAVGTDNLDNANIEIMPYLETLIGLEITDDKVKLIVPSNGDTNKDSFKTYVVTEPTGKYLMAFRIKPDSGLALVPNGVEVVYSFDELGLRLGDVLKVRNDFGKQGLTIDSEVSSEKVSRVEEVTVSRTANVLNIKATGVVPTQGWTNPQLVRVDSSEEDCYEFDFCATKPSGSVAQLETSITASVEIVEMPPFLNKVKINAKEDSYTYEID
ncbi:MAG: hypothetical protein AB8G11_10605 [Saprospiraceae bacterium]